MPISQEQTRGLAAFLHTLPKSMLNIKQGNCKQCHRSWGFS